MPPQIQKSVIAIPQNRYNYVINGCLIAPSAALGSSHMRGQILCYSYRIIKLLFLNLHPHRPHDKRMAVIIVAPRFACGLPEKVSLMGNSS